MASMKEEEEWETKSDTSSSSYELYQMGLEKAAGFSICYTIFCMGKES